MWSQNLIKKNPTQWLVKKEITGRHGSKSLVIIRYYSGLITETKFNIQFIFALLISNFAF